MNYYYNLPLELQNYIESFLLIKPKDNELLNNEDEIVKQYHLYKTKFDRITLKNKLSNIANFNQFKLYYKLKDEERTFDLDYNKYKLATKGKNSIKIQTAINRSKKDNYCNLPIVV